MLNIYKYIFLFSLYITIILVICSSFKRFAKKRKYKGKTYKKGRIGEVTVAKELSRLNSNYNVLNDIMLNVNGRTTQIDHIVVSPFGIYVIETKNYKGTLLGDEYDNYIYHRYGNSEYVIYNPLRQNRYHIRALMQTLNISDKEVFVPILAVSDECRCKISAKSDIVHFSDVCNVILRENYIIFSDQDVEEITQTLCDLNITDEEERTNHVLRIKAKYESAI